MGPTARLPRVLVWWPTQTNRQGDGRRARPSRRRARRDHRSTDDEERLLTKRSIEGQWKNTSLEQNTCLGSLTFFPGNKPVAHVPRIFCASMIGRGALRKRYAARAAQKKTCAAKLHAKWTSMEEQKHTPTVNVKPAKSVSHKCHCLVCGTTRSKEHWGILREKNPEQHREASQHRTSHGTRQLQ